MKPTEEQIKEFWEWYGWVEKSSQLGVLSYWYYYSEEIGGISLNFLPTIDPNNLFKYAVPKTIGILKGNDHEFFGWKRLFDLWLHELDSITGLADALFWVIYEVMKESK